MRSSTHASAEAIDWAITSVFFSFTQLVVSPIKTTERNHWPISLLGLNRQPPMVERTVPVVPRRVSRSNSLRETISTYIPTSPTSNARATKRNVVRIKVISIGAGGSGKSCLIKRFCEEKVSISMWISLPCHNSMCVIHTHCSLVCVKIHFNHWCRLWRESYENSGQRRKG